MRKINRRKAIRWVTLAIVLCGVSVWVYRRTDRSKPFSPDGVLVLVGGASAYLAALHQINAEKQARNDKQEAEKRAVATAILFEIDYLYRYFVREVGDFFKTNPPSPSLADELMGKRMERLPFTVYEANAGVLGTLDQSLVEGIVHLYGGFTAHLTTLNELAVETRKDWKPQPMPQYGLCARNALVQNVIHTVPYLEKLVAEVSERLCEFTGVPRERIAALTSNTSTNA